MYSHITIIRKRHKRRRDFRAQNRLVAQADNSREQSSRHRPNQRLLMHNSIPQSSDNDILQLQIAQTFHSDLQTVQWRTAQRQRQQKPL